MEELRVIGLAIGLVFLFVGFSSLYVIYRIFQTIQGQPVIYLNDRRHG